MTLGRESVVRDGCVLADRVTVGAGTLLRENVRLWPGIRLAENSLVSESMTEGGDAWEPVFSDRGVITGSAGDEVTPRRLMQMGAGTARGRVGAAAEGGPYARLLAEAFLIGAGAAGGQSFRLDAALPAAAAAAAAVFGLDTVLFVRQAGGRVFLHFFGSDGLPVDRKKQRSLTAAASEDSAAVLPEDSREAAGITGSEEAWIADALRVCGRLDGLRLSCGSRSLQQALARAGAKTVPPAEGLLRLSLSEDGFTCAAVDERGRRHEWDRLLCAVARAEFLCGARAVVLPYGAPALAEQLAAEAAGTVYRLERDGDEARRLFLAAPWCRDGLTAALRLVYLVLVKLSSPDLASFMASLPDYHTRESVLRVRSSDGAILHRLSRQQAAETVCGVRFREGETTTTVRRLGPGLLQLITEGLRMEAAEEFNSALRERIRAWDREDAAEK